MTFEEDVRNLKGRIREAIYEGKAIIFFDDYLSFFRNRTGSISSSTYYFASYISATRLSIYFRPTCWDIKKRELIGELKKYIQENGGNVL